MVRFPNLKRECGASLKPARTYGEKKVDRGENLSPKHCPNRKTSASEIHACRFGGGLKVTSLKSYLNMSENLSPHEGTQMTFTVGISSWCFFFFFFVVVVVVVDSLRTGLYSSKAVGVIRKNTEFL